jgi:hypothetical protein
VARLLLGCAAAAPEQQPLSYGVGSGEAGSGLAWDGPSVVPGESVVPNPGARAPPSPSPPCLGRRARGDAWYRPVGGRAPDAGACSLGLLLRQRLALLESDVLAVLGDDLLLRIEATGQLDHELRHPPSTPISHPLRDFLPGGSRLLRNLSAPPGAAMGGLRRPLPQLASRGRRHGIRDARGYSPRRSAHGTGDVRA